MVRTLSSCGPFFAALRVDGGEAGEVMLAFHQRRGRDHARFIERIRMVIDVARQEWRTNCSTIDVVAIGFGDGRPSGVKIRRHFVDGQNADRAWEHVI